MGRRRKLGSGPSVYLLNLPEGDNNINLQLLTRYKIERKKKVDKRGNFKQKMKGMGAISDIFSICPLTNFGLETPFKNPGSNHTFYEF